MLACLQRNQKHKPQHQCQQLINKGVNEFLFDLRIFTANKKTLHNKSHSVSALLLLNSKQYSNVSTSELLSVDTYYVKNNHNISRDEWRNIKINISKLYQAYCSGLMIVETYFKL